MQELSEIIEVPTARDSRGQTAKKAEMLVEEVKSSDKTTNDFLLGNVYRNNIILWGRLFNNWSVRTRTHHLLCIKIPNNIRQDLWSDYVGEQYQKIAPEILPVVGDIVAVSWFSKRFMPSFYQNERYVDLIALGRKEESSSWRGIPIIYWKESILMRRAGQEVDEEYKSRFDGLLRE